MVIFDCETNGLYDEADKVHVISYSIDGGDPQSIFDYDAMREFLLSQPVLIGHDIVRYDIPVLEKILGIKITAKLYDTLPMSWYVNYDRPKHGLEGYGVDFGVPKPEITDWHNLTREDYQHRCEEDVKINVKLWQSLIKYLKLLYEDKKELDRFLQYLTFKMRCASHQSITGWYVDVDRVNKNIEELSKLQDEKVEELRGIMPKRAVYDTKSPPAKMFKKDCTPTAHAQKWFEFLDDQGIDRTHTEPVKYIKDYVEPNPNSPDQVKEWLFSMGWEPCTFKYEKEDDGSERKIPQVRVSGELTPSVEVLAEKVPEVAVLAGLSVIQHRLGIFKSFKEFETNGKLKAEVAGLTNTLRFKHAKPLVNLPGVDKPWGDEIRGCLTAPPGYKLNGTDMVSLESTTKRHYMYPFDPDYVNDMSQPGFDEHLDLAMQSGYVTQEDIDRYNETGAADVAKIRKMFKPVNYGSVYGIGKVKLARTTGMSEGEAAKLIDAYWQRNWSVQAVADSLTVRTLGGKMWLKNPVSGFWINLRFPKDRFSSLNQSTGVYCFDTWLAFCWSAGVKGIGQFHDEVIVPVADGDEDEVAQLMKEAIKRTNDKLQLNVPLDVDTKYGDNYAEVH